MPAPLIPIVLGLGTLGLLALTIGAKQGTPPTRTPESTPQKDKPVTPPPAPPRPNTFPPGTVTQVVIAPSGLKVRSGPNETGTATLAVIPRYERVAIIDSTSPPLPATPAAPSGWWKVQTLAGVQGYMSAQWLFAGTDAEAHMSDADFQKYNQEHQNDEQPIFQGMGPSFGQDPAGPGHGWEWARWYRMHHHMPIPRVTHEIEPDVYSTSFMVGPTRAQALLAAAAGHFQPSTFGAIPRPEFHPGHPAGGGHPGFRPPVHHPGFRPGFRPGFQPGGLTWYTPEAYVTPYYAAQPSGTVRCVAPSGCYLRALQGGQLVPSGVVVENGALLQVLRAIPGQKTDPSSPSLGGWTLVGYSDQAAGRSYQGWLPSEWLVPA